MTTSLLRMDPFGLVFGFRTSRVRSLRIVHVYFACWLLLLNFGELS